MTDLERQEDLRRRLDAVLAAWLREGGARPTDPAAPAASPDGIAIVLAVGALGDMLANVLAVVVNRPAREAMTKATAIGLAKRVRRATNDMMENDPAYRQRLARSERAAAVARRAR